MKQRYAPATQRNREAILQVLQRWLPARGRVLEIASGTGEHAVYFAQQLPGIVWQPSDIDTDALESIAAWRHTAGLPNVLDPLYFDVHTPDPACSELDALVCINMTHIAPWSATQALLKVAATSLKPGATLYLYGPFKQADRPTAPSNMEFDAALRLRDPLWGLRHVEDIVSEAHALRLALQQIVPMPANNLSLIFSHHAHIF